MWRAIVIFSDGFSVSITASILLAFEVSSLSCATDRAEAEDAIMATAKRNKKEKVVFMSVGGLELDLDLVVVYVFVGVLGR